MHNKKANTRKQKWMDYLYNTIRFCRLEIWFTNTKTLPFWRRASIETYKTITVAIKKFMADRCTERASSLSYYSILAVVPILAISFGFAGGFGFEGTLQNLLSKIAESDSVFWNKIFEFSRNMLKNSNSGIIGGVALIFLFWIIINVITRIEVAFNRIWEIQKSRTPLRKATDYISIIVITPMLIFVAVGAKNYVSEHLTQIVDISFFQSFFKATLASTPFFSSIIIVCLLYFVLPNRKMPVLPTIISGTITGITFVIVQIMYIKLQVHMTTYNVVYGSFAALPLFLIWLRISWVILLMGAELGFGIHRRNQYIFETDYKHLSEFRKKIYAIEIMVRITKHFESKKGGLSVEDLSIEMETPQPYIYRIAKELSESGILSCIYTNDNIYPFESKYQPAFDIHSLRVSDVLNALDKHDYYADISPKNKEAYNFIENYLNEFKKIESESDKNILVKDLKWSKK